MYLYDKAIVWFRRDLRSFDHAALYHALRQSRKVYCAFVFDTGILRNLPPSDRRIAFIHASLVELDGELRRLGGYLIVRHGDPAIEIPKLARELGADAVFANDDYEPEAIARDNAVAGELQTAGRTWQSFKDQVIFDKDEVLSQAGKPFSVFTPYKNAWLKKLQSQEDDFYLRPYPIETRAQRFAAPQSAPALPTLADIGFGPAADSPVNLPSGMRGGQELFDDFADRLERYDQTRDFPAVKGPSYLSVHLRFGTVSIRGLARHARDAIRRSGARGASTWLSELVWRDFYFMILHHHPHVTTRAFKPAYDAIEWETGEHAEQLFKAWCDACTGYPLVDAAMRQINQTGYMHNRLRMVTASFLIKDLGIDWHRGERYFAERLNDFDLAANNGGWQWAASSGCDAQPYFRIFNPVAQSEKFDADGKFIRRYLPELSRLPDKYIHAPWLAPQPELAKAGVVIGQNYPAPIVLHDEARRRTLERYSVVKTVATANSPQD